MTIAGNKRSVIVFDKEKMNCEKYKPCIIKIKINLKYTGLPTHFILYKFVKICKAFWIFFFFSFFFLWLLCSWLL